MTLLKSKLLITSLLTLTLAACSGSESKEDNTRIDEDGNTIITVNDKDITAANINELMAKWDDNSPMKSGDLGNLEIEMKCEGAHSLEDIDISGCFKIDQCVEDSGNSYVIVFNVRNNVNFHGNHLYTGHNMLNFFRLNYANPNCKGDFELDDTYGGLFNMVMREVDTNTYMYVVTYGDYYYNIGFEKEDAQTSRTELLVDPTNSTRQLCIGEQMLNPEAPMSHNQRLLVQTLDAANCAVAFD